MFFPWPPCCQNQWLFIGSYPIDLSLPFNKASTPFLKHSPLLASIKFPGNISASSFVLFSSILSFLRPLNNAEWWVFILSSFLCTNSDPVLWIKIHWLLPNLYLTLYFSLELWIHKYSTQFDISIRICHTFPQLIGSIRNYVFLPPKPVPPPCIIISPWHYHLSTHYLKPEAQETSLIPLFS